MTATALIDEWQERKRREGKRPASLDAHKDACKACLAPYVGTRGRNLLRALAFNQGYDLDDPSAPDHIYRLRRKLEPHGLHIETMVNVGYRIVSTVSSKQ